MSISSLSAVARGRNVSACAKTGTQYRVGDFTAVRYIQSVTFFRIPTPVLENTSLSPQSYRMLLYLLSRPNGWTLSGNAIAEHFNIGHATVERSMSELKDFGFFYREKKKVSKGVYQWDSYVYENPRMNPYWRKHLKKRLDAVQP